MLVNLLGLWLKDLLGLYYLKDMVIKIKDFGASLPQFQEHQEDN